MDFLLNMILLNLLILLPVRSLKSIIESELSQISELSSSVVIEEMMRHLSRIFTIMLSHMIIRKLLDRL